jgi:hypothetical protein
MIRISIIFGKKMNCSRLCNEKCISVQITISWFHNKNQKTESSGLKRKPLMDVNLPSA